MSEAASGAVGGAASLGSESEDTHLKSGWLWKRTKQRSWNRRWFVLRERQLTYYKDESEYKPRQVIPTADIMTAAMVSDHSRPGHFAVYTSQRTIHLRDEDPEDAKDWADSIRYAANSVAESMLSSSFQRLDVQNGHPRSSPNAHYDMPPLDVVLANASSGAERGTANSIGPQARGQRGMERPTLETSMSDVAPASSPAPAQPPPPTNRSPHSIHGESLTTPQYTLVPHVSESSTGSFGSPQTADLSELSDHDHDHSPPHGLQQRQDSFGDHSISPSSHEPNARGTFAGQEARGGETRGAYASDSDYDHIPEYENNEKIIKQGYLYRLKNRYNQWKRQWIVLSTTRILFFKTDNIHKTPEKALTLDLVADAVDIEPLSKSKTLCMQLITDKHKVRFCADSEDDLTSWLASFKAALSRYRGRQARYHS